jgi:hypothetical protein
VAAFGGLKKFKMVAIAMVNHFCVFHFFYHFGHFHGNGSHFEKIQTFYAQLHMA